MDLRFALDEMSKKARAVLNAHPSWSRQLSTKNALIGIVFGGIILTSPYWPLANAKAAQAQEWTYRALLAGLGAGVAWFAATVLRDTLRYRKATQLVAQTEEIYDMLSNPWLTRDGNPWVIYWCNYEQMSPKEQIDVALALLDRQARQQNPPPWTSVRQRRKHQSIRVYETPTRGELDEPPAEASPTPESMRAQLHITRAARSIAHHLIDHVKVRLLFIRAAPILRVAARKKST